MAGLQNALISGVSGYLGSHIARQFLSSGWKVVALSRQTSRLPNDLSSKVLRADYDGSPRSIKEAFQIAPIDVVVHLASSISLEHDSAKIDEMVEANLRLPTHLLEQMRKEDCRCFINTGSFWQFCDGDYYSPVNLYAATKQAFEDLAESYIVNDNINFCTLTLFDTYGFDDTRGKILDLLVNAVGGRDGLRLSPGDQILDLINSADVAQAYLVVSKMMVQGELPGRSHYRLSGQRLKLKELVDVVSRISPVPLNVELGARSYRRREIMVPISDAIPILPGWSPRHNLEEDISRMVSEKVQSLQIKHD